MEIIVVTSHRKSAGTTTLCVSVARDLAARGFRTLVAEVDPARSAARSLGVPEIRAKGRVKVLTNLFYEFVDEAQSSLQGLRQTDIDFLIVDSGTWQESRLNDFIHELGPAVVLVVPADEDAIKTTPQAMAFLERLVAQSGRRWHPPCLAVVPSKSVSSVEAHAAISAHRIDVEPGAWAHAPPVQHVEVAGLDPERAHEAFREAYREITEFLAARKQWKDSR